MRYCPLCNGDMLPNGKHVYMTSCSYRGQGLTKEQVDQRAEGYFLGALEKGDGHNGAGCYDNDWDMS